MENTIVEIKKATLMKNRFKVECAKHPELNSFVSGGEVVQEMYRIADVLNNKYNEGCAFTVEE